MENTMVISCHTGGQKFEYLSDEMVARSMICCQHRAQQKSSLIIGNEYTMSSCCLQQLTCHFFSWMKYCNMVWTVINVKGLVHHQQLYKPKIWVFMEVKFIVVWWVTVPRSHVANILEEPAVSIFRANIAKSTRPQLKKKSTSSYYIITTLKFFFWAYLTASVSLSSFLESMDR